MSFASFLSLTALSCNLFCPSVIETDYFGIDSELSVAVPLKFIALYITVIALHYFTITLL